MEKSLASLKFLRGYILNYNLSNFYLSLIKIFFGSMIHSIQICFYMKWPISNDQYGRQLLSWILQIYSYIHDAIDNSCNKFIPWGLNALVLCMEKDEGLYEKLLSSLFTFRNFFGCWQNSFQTPSFKANFFFFSIHFDAQQFSVRKRLWTLIIN